MPSNEDFRCRILIDGTTVAEYQIDGLTYVECNLATNISYKQSVVETVNGELESQECPVTPYEIEIEASPARNRKHYYRVFVDGVKVKGLSLDPGEKRLIKGFRDGAVIRELLFSMPRFSKDESDKLSYERLNKVGQIEVECWEAELKTSEWKTRGKMLDFSQASKKDSLSVTQGHYMMATSKAGRAVCPRRIFRCVDNWKRKSLKSSLIILYRMSHELVEMGFKLQPFNKQTKPVSNSGDFCDAAMNAVVETNDSSSPLSSDHIPAVKLEADVKSNICGSEPICIDLTSDCEDGSDVLHCKQISVTLPNNFESNSDSAEKEGYELSANS